MTAPYMQEYRPPITLERQEKTVSIAAIMAIIVVSGTIIGSAGWMQMYSFAAPALAALVGLLFGGLHRRAIFIAALLFANALIGLLLSQDALMINVLVWTLTHSSLLLLLVNFRMSELILCRVIRFLCVLLVIESVIGIGQFLIINGFGSFYHMAAGDYVTGTLGRSGAGNSISFTLLITILLCYIWSAKKFFQGGWAQIRLIALVIVPLTIILASNIHQLIATIAGISLFAIHDPRGKHHARRLWVMIVSAIAILFGWLTFSFLQADNVGYASLLVNRTLQTIQGDSPVAIRKIVGLKNTLVSLPEMNAAAPVVGVGPGQYSSRAALIMSGSYLDSGFLFAPQSTTYTQNLITPLWNRFIYTQNYQNGNANMPFSTVQSIYAEFGIPIFLFVVIGTYMYFRKRLSLDTPTAKGEFLSYSIFLFVCFFDNYLEFPKAASMAMLLWLLVRQTYPHAHSRSS